MTASNLGLTSPTALVAFGKLVSGNYYLTGFATGLSTSAAQGNGTLKLAPWFVSNACIISRVGAETTVNGEAGSVFRVGVYADNGFGYPGALLLDAGTIAGDGTAGVKEITGLSLALPLGLYWVGGAVQAAPTTQPTMRTIATSAWPGWSSGTAAPAAGSTPIAYTQASVTGALPSTFSSTLTVGGSISRVHVKV